MHFKNLSRTSKQLQDYLRLTPKLRIITPYYLFVHIMPYQFPKVKIFERIVSLEKFYFEVEPGGEVFLVFFKNIKIWGSGGSVRLLKL